MTSTAVNDWGPTLSSQLEGLSVEDVVKRLRDVVQAMVANEGQAASMARRTLSAVTAVARDSQDPQLLAIGKAWRSLADAPGPVSARARTRKLFDLTDQSFDPPGSKSHYPAGSVFVGGWGEGIGPLGIDRQFRRVRAAISLAARGRASDAQVDALKKLSAEMVDPEDTNRRGEPLVPEDVQPIWAAMKAALGDASEHHNLLHLQTELVTALQIERSASRS